MRKTIKRKIKEERKALIQSWVGYYEEQDLYYKDLYLADISKAEDEISRLESLLREPGELGNKLPL